MVGGVAFLSWAVGGSESLSLTFFQKKNAPELQKKCVE
jgi:hypothetical protein